MNQLLKKYPDEINKILTKYPTERKQAAVMPLLHLAQSETGFISRTAMQEVAEITGVTVTEVASVVGFYTLYHDAPGGKIRLQVCTDVACDLRGAKEYLAELCAQLGVKSGETSTDGLITIEEVPCLAACDRAPLFQSQIGSEIEYHENQTPARTLDWLRSMSAALLGSPLKTVKTETAPDTTTTAENGVSHE
jgi:NADH-quinone oxidoreductase subunit E